MGVYREGYDWNGTPAEQFSYHPLFMFIGLVFLYGNGQNDFDIQRLTHALVRVFFKRNVLYCSRFTYLLSYLLTYTLSAAAAQGPK